MNKNKTQQLSLILSVLLLSLLTAYLVFAWTDAPEIPPGCPSEYPGCDAPINVGPADQTKSGGLEVNFLSVSSADSDKIKFFGTQVDPHTVWLGNNKGIRFWDDINGELMRITNTGNIGIGTVAPNDKLEVYGDLRINTAALNNDEIFFTDNGQIRSRDNNHRILFRRSENKMELREYGDLIFSPGATSGLETAKVVMKSNGNVGVGDSTPDYKLDVDGNIGLTGTHLVYDSAGGIIDWGSSGSGSLYFRTLSTQGDIGTYTERARIFNDGDLWTDGCVYNWGSCMYSEGMSTYVMNTDYWYESGNDGGAIYAGTDNAELYIRGSVLFDCPSCGSASVLDGSSDWGDMSIQGRVISANSNIHLSPPGGYNVVIDDSYRAAGGSSSGAAGLSVEGNISTYGDISATNNSLTSCAWECAGGEYDTGTFTNICNSGKVAAGIRTKKAVRDWLGLRSYYVYDVCVYCCEL